MVHKTPGVAGFTLVEVMVVVAVSAIVAMLAVPALLFGFDGMRRSALINEALAHLLMTRSEAVKRGARVVMCKSADGASCSTSDRWDQGWIVFHDADNDAIRDAGEALINHRQALPDDWVLSGNTQVSKYVSYTATGDARLVSGAFQAGTITLCRASDDVVDATQIIISSSGRPRTKKTTLASCG